MKCIYITDFHLKKNFPTGIEIIGYYFVHAFCMEDHHPIYMQVFIYTAVVGNSHNKWPKSLLTLISRRVTTKFCPSPLKSIHCVISLQVQNEHNTLVSNHFYSVKTFFIFVWQTTWFWWNVMHWTSGVNVHNKNSNQYGAFYRSST